MALTEKRPKEAPREERQVLKALCAEVVQYHSGAAREDRAGALPLQRTRATAEAVSRVEPWDVAVSPLNLLRGGTFCFAPNI